MEHHYLTVGTDYISNDFFRKVQDSNNKDNMKPSGGLWMTKFQEEYPTYNVWVDFIIQNLSVFFYKNPSSYLFSRPCSVITLKKNANVFLLDSKEKLDVLRKNYPKEVGYFSFEALSQDYDGIYVSLTKILPTLELEEQKQFRKFGVDSLLLFNTSCIDYYKRANLEIEPFDYEDFYARRNAIYRIYVEQEKRYMEPENQKYSLLLSKISEAIFEYLKDKNVTLTDLQEHHLLEQAFRVIEEKYYEEIGNVLQELNQNTNGEFSSDDVTKMIARKLIRM